MCLISLTGRNSIMAWENWKTGSLSQWKAWWLARHPEEVGEYSWTYLFERGKQIRPRLFCELWQSLCPDQPVCAEGAFLIECAHVASLILDDLPWMDNAETRRGWVTLHRKFSLRKALLLAHDVLELAYEVGRSCPLLEERVRMFQKKRDEESERKKEEWMERGREKAKSLWLGQWLDVSRNGTLYEMAAWKTGTLFEAVAEGVAVGIGLDPHFWKQWGNALGVLFQWVDDWDDREEDMRIGQRNAFNEAPEETAEMYRVLWTVVVQGIGPSWWKRPFGSYLWRYFTRVVDGMDALSSNNIPALASVSVPLPLPLSSLSTWFDSLPVLSLPSTFSATTLSTPTNECPALHFMRLFMPYLDHRPTEDEKEALHTTSLPEEWDIYELWTIPEEEWMKTLEKKGKTSPELQWFLPSLRVVERMCRDTPCSYGLEAGLAAEA